MSECNLHKDVVNPSEMNSTNNLILDCDQSITALIEELNDLDMFPINVQNHCNIDNVENNMTNNNPNDCCSNNNSNNNDDNNMETEDNINNMETENNDRDEARHIFDIPNNCNVYENNMVNDNLDDYHSNNDNMDNNMETENNVTDGACNNAFFPNEDALIRCAEPRQNFEPLTAKSAFGTARSIPNIPERRHPTTAEHGPLSASSAKKREPAYYFNYLLIFGSKRPAGYINQSDCYQARQS